MVRIVLYYFQEVGRMEVNVYSHDPDFKTMALVVNQLLECAAFNLTWLFTAVVL